MTQELNQQLGSDPEPSSSGSRASKSEPHSSHLCRGLSCWLWDLSVECAGTAAWSPWINIMGSEKCHDAIWLGGELHIVVTDGHQNGKLTHVDCYLHVVIINESSCPVLRQYWYKVYESIHVELHVSVCELSPFCCTFLLVREQRCHSHWQSFLHI